MRGADEEAGGMGNDETDEADGTDHADHACRHRRCHAEQGELHAAHGDAEGGCGIRAEGEGIERARMGKTDDEACQRDRHGEIDIRPAHATERP